MEKLHYLFSILLNDSYYRYRLDFECQCNLSQLTPSSSIAEKQQNFQKLSTNRYYIWLSTFSYALSSTGQTVRCHFLYRNSKLELQCSQVVLVRSQVLFQIQDQVQSQVQVQVQTHGQVHIPARTQDQIPQYPQAWTEDWS